MESQVRIAVTGAHGMLGTHLRAYLRAFPSLEVVPIGRKEFAGDLSRELHGCDVVFHLAGMNRGNEDEVAWINMELTERLIAALEEVESRAHVLFSSSTHVDRPTPYGQSKRRAAERLEAWAGRSSSSGRFTNVVLPGVFGEGGRPFYNSVVATFCHQVAHGQTPTVDDAPTEQIHAQEVSRQLWRMVQRGETGTVRVQGKQLTVRGLLTTLQEMRDVYAEHVIPDISDPFQRDLFNMYRSFLYPAHYPVPLTLHTDPRGSLFEAIKSPSGGQAFMSTTHPGVTRGNHFHTRKVERFLVSGGEAEIRLRHLFRDEVQTFRVSGKQPAYVDIPTLHTHNITNVGEGTLLTLFWTNELFDPNDPDQVPELVKRP